MGKFTYNSGLVVDFDDRLLAHLQVVIATKLRRHESFVFSWRDDDNVGDGRTSIWLDHTIPMVFKYLGGRPPLINRAWVELLSTSANSPAGLTLLPEPADK